MRKDASFPPRVLEKYPFLQDIINVSKNHDPDQLINVLKFCIYKLKLIKKFEPLSLSLEWEKKTEAMTTKLGERMKSEVVRIAKILDIGSSILIRDAIEHYLDRLYEDIPSLDKPETGSS